MRICYATFLCIHAVLLAGIAGTSAQEEIVQFNSQIVVQEDGVIAVTERLRVKAQGVRIRHGIYRDFPQIYRGPLGLNAKTAFRVVAAKRDGQVEPFRTERRNNGMRVYIGSQNHVISPGIHDFELVYVTDNQIGFFPSHDELYWNVNGNGWVFRILQAAATVELPPGANPTNLVAYVGAYGERGQAYVAEVKDGKAQFRTTRQLYPSEGLTVVVEWPKGFVTAPDFWDRCGRLIEANAGVVSGVVGLLVVLIYYTAVWIVVGRDPSAGTIIPLYAPPQHFSPAAVRYLLRLGEFDKRTFTAAVLHLAVQGKLTVREEENKAYILVRTDANARRLQSEEVGLLRELFRDGERLSLQPTNHERLQKAHRVVRSQLRKHLEKTFFLRNSGYWVPGILLTLAPLGFSFLQFSKTGGSGALFVWILGLFLLGVVLNLAFYHWLKAPTRLGRLLLDQIEGFKLYLSVAEEDRLNLENPPERTPELFEKFLPYALALDVEQKWSEQFADVLATAAEGPVGYAPSWYTGSSWSRLGSSGFAHAVGDSLSSAISSASTPPGSSPGGFSGGGSGFSGGGGGGGGGGGW